MRSALIIGCGYVGTTLGHRLSDLGLHVYGIRRNKGQDQKIQMIAQDIFDCNSSDLPPADLIYYLISPDHRTPESYARCYVHGLKHLLSILKYRPQKIILSSSTGIHAENDGQVITELTPIDPCNFKIRALHEAETIIRNLPVPHTIARFSGIYGPGRDRILKKILENKFSFSNHQQYSNRIHLNDCVGALIHLIPKDGTYIVSDPNPTPLNTIISWVSTKYGIPITLSHTDAPSRPKGKRCSSTKLIESGYQFQYPSYHSGLATLFPKETSTSA